MLRESGYLSDPQVYNRHRGLAAGVVLSESLIDFSSTAKSNYELFVDAQATGANYVHKAVYVTEEDEKHNLKIENCSKKEIKRQAFDIDSK